MSTPVLSHMTCESFDPIVHQFPTSDELGQAVGARIVAMSKLAIQQRGEFSIAFSGGSLPGLVANSLVEHQTQVDFTKWKVFLADERHVASDSPDCNLKAVKDLLLSKLENPPFQVFGLDYSLPVEQAAIKYAKHLPTEGLDLVLLGMGPDGHTASLFPGHELLTYTGDSPVVAIKDSPKPPPERITLTLKYINTHAKQVWFVTTGAGKQDAVMRCAVPLSELEPNPLPSARVRPMQSAVEWYVDTEAGARLL
ncbi:6-phosphogluconolactonase [Batrachochytrium salamandrivorans]|nr:6-phosphogluconolactonase [Batrachochytrium salamandrivorans]